MKELPYVDEQEVVHLFEDLVNVPSVVAHYPQIHAWMEKTLNEYGYSVFYDNKRTLYAKLEGKDHSKTVCFGAHLDTIGLIVRQVDPNGWIQVKNLGGINFHSIEGENVYIHTRQGKTYTGMVIHQSHSVHVFDDAKDASRDVSTMRILLDEEVHSDQDVYDLGIEHGDLVSIEPRCIITRSGYIKSRHIDDKACVASLLEAMKCLKENQIIPEYDTLFAFPIYEEIGHGGAYVPSEVDTYIALDIGLIGPDYHGTEKSVCIGGADAYSPYDWELTTRLYTLAKTYSIPACIDIYYRFGSDGTAAIRVGQNVKAAVFGMGCMNSHSYERTHVSSLVEVSRLVLAYLMNEK